MAEPVDPTTPWTIRAVATRTRDAITAAAKRENLTVGQWLERRVDEWTTAGSPEPRGSIVGELAELIRAIGAIPPGSKLPYELTRTINAIARHMRVRQDQQPRLTAPPLNHEAPPTTDA